MKMLNLRQSHTSQIRALRYSLPLFLFFLLLSSLNATVVRANELYVGKQPIPPAVELVAKQTDDLLTQLHVRRIEFTEHPIKLIEYAKDVALKHWDIKRTSRLILGPYWRSANNESRHNFEEQYLKTLLRYVIRAYGYYDESLLEVVAYDWKPLRTGGWVLSKVRIPGGVTIAVDYRMIKDKKTKQWRLIDIRAEGISLVNVKKTEYRKIVKRDGMDGLLTLMSKKNDAVLQPIFVTASH